MTLKRADRPCNDTNLLSHLNRLTGAYHQQLSPQAFLVALDDVTLARAHQLVSRLARPGYSAVSSGHCAQTGLLFTRLHFNMAQVTLIKLSFCPQHFQGNTDKYTAVTHKLSSPIIARFIRFVVLEWHTTSFNFGLRVEIYGCN